MNNTKSNRLRCSSCSKLADHEMNSKPWCGTLECYLKIAEVTNAREKDPKEFLKKARWMK